MQNKRSDRACVTLSPRGETPRIGATVASHLHNTLKCSAVIAAWPASHSVTSDLDWPVEAKWQRLPEERRPTGL